MKYSNEVTNDKVLVLVLAQANGLVLFGTYMSK